MPQAEFPMRYDCAAGAVGLKFMLKRFQANRTSVRVKKARQIRKQSLPSDSIGTEKALYSAAMVREPRKRGARRAGMACPTTKE
jgi:hypothetical protein